MSTSFRSALKGLYAITDPHLMGRDLLKMSEQAISAGINILQYRNKIASKNVQGEEAAELSALCKKHHVLFIVNDDAELAKKVDADGVHLGQKDMSPARARELLGKDKIIGVSCNNQLALAIEAQQQGADYIAFGRFFNSMTKPDAPQAELALLTAAQQSITVPIVAIGGITPDTAPVLLKSGASMLAVINSLFAQDNISRATREFIEIIQRLDTPSTST